LCGQKAARLGEKPRRLDYRLTRPERLHDAFPGKALTRFRELKAAYDPENVFDQNFPIT
jgi:FAD/FMN-containing dehydrogenase